MFCICFLSDKTCKAYKFARPYHGPYQVVELIKARAVVRPIDRKQGGGIRVAFIVV